MRVEEHPNGTRVVLSERNLRSLLTKLGQADLGPHGSACTIEMNGIYVSAEPDAQHYGDRVPGPMHPLTERALRG